MKTAAEYKDFIGIYDESVPVKLCEEFVNNWVEDSVIKFQLI